MKKNLIWVAFAMLISIYSCKKEEINTERDPEALSAADVEILDNLPEATGFSSKSVVLPDGEILDSYLHKNDSLFYNLWVRSDPVDIKGLIARVTAVALKLTDRSKYQKANEGAGKPAQNGLAYSWGSKNHNIREIPGARDCSGKRNAQSGTSCTDGIYGLDCSGFIHQLFTNAGVSLLCGPAESQRQPGVLQNAIKSSIPALDSLKVEYLGEISTSQFETGDIISWIEKSGVAQHIGIVLKDTLGNLAVFQSNGSSGNSADDCLKNISVKRGPRSLQLNDPYWFGQGKSYGITRINTEKNSDPDPDPDPGKSPIKLTLSNGDVIYVYPVYDLDTVVGGGVIWSEFAINITALPEIVTYADAYKDFNGEANTQAIVDQLGDNNGTLYAAKFCADLVAYGFNDWYLPAAGELDEMIHKLGDFTSGGSGDIPWSSLWSSTEWTDQYAWFSFDGGMRGYTKHQKVECRCVRR